MPHHCPATSGTSPRRRTDDCRSRPARARLHRRDRNRDTSRALARSLPPGARMVSESPRILTQQLVAVDPDFRVKAADLRRAVMVAIIGEQCHAQRKPSRRADPRPAAAASRIGRMGAGLHPDACLDLAVADFVTPDRNRTVEMEASDPHMTRRRDGAALPAVGEQRPRPAPSMQWHPPWRRRAAARAAMRPARSASP